MQNQQIRKIERSNTSSSLPSYIVKIYVNPRQLAQIVIYPDSDIDMLINECIIKYKLKKQAHSFLKQQIQLNMDQSKNNYRCKTEYPINKKLFIQSSDCIRNPLVKKQTILRDLKFGDIDKNRISIQRTPKNIDNVSFKKETIVKHPKPQNQCNPKIYIRKKTQSQKQNIDNTYFFNKKQLQDSTHKFKFMKNKQDRLNLSKNLSTQKLTKMRKYSHDKAYEEKFFQQNQFMNSLQKESPLLQAIQKQERTMKRKLKTQVDIEPSLKMKQFSLVDLQKQMQQQMVDLKFEKKIKRLQPQLCNLFNSIIRRNPPKINRIDPRYACFDDLSEVVIKGLHQFLVNLQDNELNSLDFQNFKKLLIKYRGDYLLSCLK